MPTSPWERAKKILCIRLDTIGDVLMTTPAFRALKESGNRPLLTLLTSSIGGPIGRLVPEIDHVMVYDCPWMKATERRTGAEVDFDVIARLKAEEFDATRKRLQSLPPPAAQGAPVLVALGSLDLKQRRIREAEAAFIRAQTIAFHGDKPSGISRGTQDRSRRRLYS